MADEKHFVDKHRIKLIEKVSNIPAILDELLRENVIQEDSYDKIRALPTSQEKMKELFSGPLEASGVQGKEMFYKILNKHESYLINDLETTEVPVETMTTKKMLFETLNDLSSEELQTFKSLFELEKGFPLSPRRLLEMANTQDTVELMVETDSHECVELTKKVLKMMNRTDLVQRLSDISSGTKEKQQPSLIQRVETMASVIELLLETLKELRDGELQKFKKVLVSQTDFYRHFSDAPWMQRESIDRQDIVFSVVEIYGQKSVEKTKEVLKNMKRTDLVQKLSDSSSAPKKKHSVDEHLSALIHKVATVRAVKELLLETLRGLSSEELQKFKWLLQFRFFQRGVLKYSPRQLQLTDDADELVDMMLNNYDQQSVEVTREVLMTMKRTDLVQKLSETSSGTKAAGSSAEASGVSTTEKEKLSALIPKVETMASVIELLLETLKELRDGELQKFKKVLVSQTDFYRHFSDAPWMLWESIDRQDIVFSVVEIYGQQSVEKTKEVLKNMKRTDLVQKLSDSSSAPKKKHSVDEHLSALIHKVATMSAVKELLLETLRGLSSKEIEKFKWLLKFTIFQRGVPNTLWRRLQFTVRADELVDGMLEIYGQQSVEMTREVLMEMKRTDLVQKLSETSSGTKAAGSSAEASGVSTTEKEKLSVDEHWPALIQKVETMMSVIELLLETLKELRDGELQTFKKAIVSQTDFYRNFSDNPSMQQGSTDRQDIVFSVVEIYGQQSVEKTKEVLKNMKRTDLVQKLSDSSSAPKKKHSVDEHLSALIHKVATVSAVKELLLETLRGLSSEEIEKFKWLLHFTIFQRSVPNTSWRGLQHSVGADELVDGMLEIYGQQSVEMTREVLMEMKRTDLVQKLSETSSGTKAAGSSAEASGVSITEKEKLSVDEHCPALIQKVETMASVIDLLLETLKKLRDRELQKFKKVIVSQTDFHRLFSDDPWMQRGSTDRQDIVFSVVLTYGQQSVEKTKEVLKNMKRTDLVQKLSDSSSAPKKKHSDALIQKVATIAAIKQLLMETLNDLNNEELWEFKRSLKWFFSQKNLPDSSWMLIDPEYRAQIVDLMLEIYGQQSVEVTRDVFMVMNRTDLVQRLSKPSSGLKEKHSVDEHGPALSEREVTMTSLMEKLLETLKDLSYGELEQFKHVLQYINMKKSFPRISGQRMETADRDEMVELMVEIYGHQSVEVTREVLMKMNRRDLVQRLSDISSGSKGPSTSLELEGCGSTMQFSSDWTKLQPEVTLTDADEAPTYSLQSEAGIFECSVSGLRWVCKEKVSFKYQFCSWEGIMERMESLQYMPAGPLMDITVIAGKLDEVYLTHWICIDGNPEILDKFAVLHIDDCGDSVEKVSEVTSSHVKLSEPVFSPRAVLIKMGLPVKIGCQVLIYYIPNTSFLRLHVYLIPHDHGLQQTVDKKKEKKGYKRIEKPRPDKYLKMQQGFKLAADIPMAKILPEKITLRYDSQDPNFYEVFIENPDTNFHLTLSPLNKKKKGKPQCEPVWICEIQKVDYQNSADSEETCGQSPIQGLSDKKPSLDARLSALMKKAATVTTDKERILIMLQDLNKQEFEQFIWQLENSDIGAGRERIPRSKLENSNMFDLVNQMWKTYIQQSVEVTMKVLKQIDRNDLVQILSDTSSGSKEKLCG
ncbi:uncharacterized protein LOC116060966 [Sander lucioperca]|uniref:uncharacterized protein LOC116060966 n=1 Tax=Sander lucioperca TaxID=283035 RepID=UPI00165354D6|nr:uncharacterized protein LOC116060966 [Sander lucioperca]